MEVVVAGLTEWGGESSSSFSPVRVDGLLQTGTSTLLGEGGTHLPFFQASLHI